MFIPGTLLAGCLYLVHCSLDVYTWYTARWMFIPGTLLAGCLYLVHCSLDVYTWYTARWMFIPDTLLAGCLYLVHCSLDVYPWYVETSCEQCISYKHPASIVLGINIQRAVYQV
jgi:hypothetical protein